MKKYCFFSSREFTRLLSKDEIQQVKTNLQTLDYLDEWKVRLSIIRAAFGGPVFINSWYRDEEHNKRVGGNPTSQHLDGSAVDIDSRDNARLFATIKQLQREGMDFGQIITYGSGQYRFLHLSLPTRNKINEYLQYP